MTLDRSKLGRRSRRKGQNFERLIASELRAFWPDAKRGLQSRGGTKEAPDVENTPYYIECKNENRTQPKAAIEQARENSDGRPPLAITRDTNGPVLVTMDLETFRKLHERIRELEDQVRQLGDSSYSEQEWDGDFHDPT